MRIPPSLSILPIFFAIAACDLDIKHCIGDCTQGASDSQTGDPTPDTTGDLTTDGNPGPVTTGDPGELTDGGTDPTGGDELGTCEIVDDIPLADTCFDGQFTAGELCILGTFGFGTPATSSLVLPLDAHHGADLLLTPGDGSVEARLFAPATTSSLTWAQTIGAQPILRASGDFDEDGVLDVLAHTVEPTGLEIHALFLDGAGGLATDQIVHTADNVVALDAVDWDGDGHLDIVTLANTPGLDALVILLGDGTGNFTLTTGPVVEPSTPGYVLGALDGDGRPDDFVFVQGGSAVIVRNQGLVQQTLAPGMPAEVWFHEFILADLDGDGVTDLAGVGTNTATETSELVVFLQDSGDFPSFARYPVHCGARVLAVGDLDSDGVLDLVTAGTGPGSIRRGDGQGGFAQHLQIFLGALNEGDGLHVADLEGDGSPDIVGVPAVGLGISVVYNRP